MSKIEAGMVTPRTNALDHFVSQVVIWRAIQGCHLEDRASGRYFGTGVPPILEPWQSGQESWARPAAQAWLSQRTAEERFDSSCVTTGEGATLILSSTKRLRLLEARTLFFQPL